MLPLFFILFIYVKKWKRKARKQLGEGRLLKKIIKSYSPVRFSFKFLLLTLAFALGILAIMSLRKPSGNDGILREGVDVVFALDVSKSMLAKDLTPDRLTKAKQLIADLIKSMPENRVAILLFAGKAYMQMPLTTDHSAAQMMIADASPESVPFKGTNLSEALKESLKAFGKREAKYKAVILISDGEDHDAAAISISKEMATHGLMVNTVGIGSPQGSYIPDDSTSGNKIDEAGNAIVSKLNEEELQAIATNTKGIYIRLSNTDDAVKKINGQLNRIDKYVTGDMHLMSYTYFFWIFVGAMLILLMTEQLLPESRRIKN